MRIFPDTYAVGAQFGVVLVPIPDNPQQSVIPSEAGVSRSKSPAQSRDLLLGSTSKAAHVEVATFRSDIGYSDGRHPDQVRFSRDLREDVQRRDFTINGLLLDPLNDEVLDYVGGQKDLEAKIIRAIGDPALRFAEDKLRILRAVRFAARFQYAIEPATLASIQEVPAQIPPLSPRPRPHSLPLSCRRGRENGGSHLPPPALFQWRYRTDSGAGGQSHALRGRRKDESFDV